MSFRAYLILCGATFLSPMCLPFVGPAGFDVLPFFLTCQKCRKFVQVTCLITFFQSFYLAFFLSLLLFVCWGQEHSLMGLRSTKSAFDKVRACLYSVICLQAVLYF